MFMKNYAVNVEIVTSSRALDMQTFDVCTKTGFSLEQNDMYQMTCININVVFFSICVCMYACVSSCVTIIGVSMLRTERQCI